MAMRRSPELESMRSMTWFLVCAALLSSRAHAQGMISGAKAVAGRAAAATNAHTQAEQNPTPAITPSKTTPIVTTAAPAGAKTTPVAATAAKTTPIAAPAAAKTTPIAAPAAAKTTPVPAAATKAVAVTAKAAPATKTAAAPPMVSADTEARSISVTQRGIKGEVSLNREVFSYDAGGRRDPFVSLLRNGDLRPMLNDLRLVTVLYDPTGRNSVAVMRDLTTRDQYRVKVGQTLGRMRVAGIEPREILFTIEEIGFSRQVGLV